MTGAMAAKLIKMCTANYPSYGESNESKGMLWMQTFQKEPDDLMQTAIISCMSICKKFPTVADIKEAIRDLRYEEQSKPKQLAYEVKRDDTLHKKIMDMASGKTDTKEYIKNMDISDVLEHARFNFPNISESTIRDNYPELLEGLKCQEMCWNCRIDVNACLTKGYVIKHNMHPSGRIKNEMAQCQKKIKH